jgi:membrane-bound metal-dependent hydrolase YbcI (DUF457 family)
MARRRTHLAFGVAAGVGYAGYRATKSAMGNPLIESFGGGLGGAGGGTLPDILEPASGGQHRRTAHSLLVGGALAAAAQTIEVWAEALRRRAAELEQEAASGLFDEARCIALRLGAWICWFIAGLLNGLVAGYVSHLVLDLGTPAGLPVV